MRIREIIPNEVVVPVLIKPLPEYFELEEVQDTVVRAIDGKRSIADIVLESRSSAFRVSETLCYLAHQSFVQFIDPRAQKAAEAVAAEANVTPAFGIGATEEDEITSMINRAQQAIRSRDFEKAQRLLRAAQNLDPNHAKVRTAVKAAETLIINELRRDGLLDSKVPKVARSFEEITQMNFTPNEGFILSRINGQWDIGSLIKISPIRETDALLIFHKLWKDGIIALA
jgi:hypothetical protein